MKTLTFQRNAFKALKHIPAKDAEALRAKLGALAEGRRDGLDVTPLKGYRYQRLRHGDWRAVIDETAGQIEVVVIAHRREVYR
jgi:mRNA-degrading endonuclease RelE of RelBE toxin-antitoxin system